MLVDLETPKSAELSAQYDFYSDSMNTIRNRMGITPEQADEVFIALIDSGLDGKITLITKKDNGKSATERIFFTRNTSNITSCLTAT